MDMIYGHFSDEETEVYRGQIVCSNYHCKKTLRLGGKDHILVSEKSIAHPQCQIVVHEYIDTICKILKLSC